MLYNSYDNSYDNGYDSDEYEIMMSTLYWANKTFQTAICL